MDKLSAKKVSLSLAVVSAIVYLVCALLIAIVPSFIINVFVALFHGVDISKIAMPSFVIGRTILGLFGVIIIASIFGWLYASVYNKIK